MSVETTSSVASDVDLASLVERVEQLEEKVDELEEENERLREELESTRDYEAERRSWLQERVSDVEEKIEDSSEGSNPNPQVEENPVHEPDTALEKVVGLPEEYRDSLTKNQNRALWIVEQLDEYATRTKAGHVLTSSKIRTILTAKMDSKAHTETVSRVMSALDTLGGDSVTTRKRRDGKRIVVFQEDLMERLRNDHKRCDRELGKEPLLT